MERPAGGAISTLDTTSSSRTTAITAADHNDARASQIYHTTFDQNTGAYGAGLRTEGRIDYGMNLTFTQNTATWDGGGFYSNSSASNRTTMTNVAFLNNTATNGYGGGLFARNNVTVTLFNATIAGNRQARRAGSGRAMPR
jgi:predicted outer membrane repeat protein